MRNLEELMAAPDAEASDERARWRIRRDGYSCQAALAAAHDEPNTETLPIESPSERNQATMDDELRYAVRVAASRVEAFITNSRYDGRELTKAARDKFAQRFLDEVDPQRELPEDERNRRADMARKAYYARLSLASAQARRAAVQQRKDAWMAEGIAFKDVSKG